MNVNVGDIIFQLVIFGLISLFFVSFALCIRSLINNQRKKVHSNSNIEAKLDKIIELLENDKMKK